MEREQHTPGHGGGIIWAGPILALAARWREHAALFRAYGIKRIAILLSLLAQQIEEAVARAAGSEWITIEEACQLLPNKTADTLREWARTGRVRAHKTGGTWLLHRNDLMGETA